VSLKFATTGTSVQSDCVL